MTHIKNAKFGEVYKWEEDGWLVMCVWHKGDDDWSVLPLVKDPISGHYPIGEPTDELVTDQAVPGSVDYGWIRIRD